MIAATSATQSQANHCGAVNCGNAAGHQIPIASTAATHPTNAT